MSTETADELSCRGCGEPFGNPGALATHERACSETEASTNTSEETDEPTEPSEPPYVECRECGRRLPWRPIVQSYAWRANHVNREHEGGGRTSDYFEWVGRDDAGEISVDDLEAAIEEAGDG